MSIRCLIVALARWESKGIWHFVFDTYPARTCSRRKTCPRQRPVSSSMAGAGLDAGLARCPRELVTVEAPGTRNGKNAAKHAQQIGFPEGVNVWLDLEGAKALTPHETMIAVLQRMVRPKIEDKRDSFPGVYVGARAILTGNELFWCSMTKHYWKSRNRISYRSPYIAVISSFNRSSATTKLMVLQSIAISPRTTTSAAPCSGCPRVDRLTREFLNRTAASSLRSAMSEIDQYPTVPTAAFRDLI